MSVLDKIEGESRPEILEKLPNVLMEYEELLEKAIDEINIKGKTLEKANREWSALMAYYSQKTSELKILYQYVEQQVNAVRGQLFKHYKTKNQHDLNEREIMKFIECDSKYTNVKEVLLYVEELYEKFKGICSSLEGQQYLLTNITKARVAEVHNIEIW